MVLFFQVGRAQSVPLRTADWITVPYPDGAVVRSCPVFFRDFLLKKKVKSAVLYISALGLYEARMNGKRIGEDYFTPGFTVYNKRLQYQRYEVSRLLGSGRGAIGYRSWWARDGTEGISGTSRGSIDPIFLASDVD